jgi:hypothetical protein
MGEKIYKERKAPPSKNTMKISDNGKNIPGKTKNTLEY